MTQIELDAYRAIISISKSLDQLTELLAMQQRTLFDLAKKLTEEKED